MRGLLYLAIGAIVFVTITFFEQLPVLGWLGGVLSIAAWIALTRALMSDREWDVKSSGIGLAWSGIIGAFTGFVGALTAWLAQTGNLFGFTTPPGDRFGALFGFIGASLGIVLWPLVGALVCVITALAVTTKRAG
ncbi:MAG: hypothetical protein Q7S41_04365 [Candidatus Limnocylindria bacterium]|nr:hypothetical protein [Candidatus Limnocylindria bacterium]